MSKNVLDKDNLGNKSTSLDLVRYPIAGAEFDNRAFSTTESKLGYLNCRRELMKSVWTSWPRRVIITIWLAAAIGFGGLLLLVKVNPDLARRVIDIWF